MRHPKRYYKQLEYKFTFSCLSPFTAIAIVIADNTPQPALLLNLKLPLHSLQHNRPQLRAPELDDLPAILLPLLRAPIPYDLRN
jgi:hypothetical protein